MSFFTQKLRREITQTVFRPNLGWYASRAEIAKELENEYEEWLAKKDGNIALYSPKISTAFEVFTDNLTHIRENNFNNTNNIAHITSILEKMHQKMPVKEVRRDGFRITALYETTFAFPELVSILEKKLFNLPKSSPQAGTPVDLAYILDTKIDSMIIHTQIGATKAEEGMEKFDAKFGIEKKLEKEANLFIDVDVSIKQNLSIENNQEALSILYEIGNQTVENYLEFLSEG